jgi:DNA mismatch repair ATPase MutS
LDGKPKDINCIRLLNKHRHHHHQVVYIGVQMPTAPRIGSAYDLRSCLEGVLDKTKDKKEINEDANDFRSKIKTYLIESNNPSVSALVQDKIIIKDTLDDNLKVLRATSKRGRDYELYLDTTDKRFWKIYSLNKSEVSDKIINMLVLRNKNKLDFAWFPSSLLEKYMSLGTETGFSLKP